MLKKLFVLHFVVHVALGMTQEQETKPFQLSDIKIIVVGAGAAGLSAAQKLLERNFDVKILEAQDFIGGRMQSKNVTNGWIDFGANIVTEMGELPALLRELGYIEPFPIQTLLYASDVHGPLPEGTYMNTDELGTLFTQLADSMINIPATDAKDITAGAFMDAFYSTLIDTAKGQKSETKLTTAMYDFIVRVYRNYASADSLHDVAVKMFNTLYMQSSMNSVLNVPFTKVTEMLAEKIPKEKILLNKEVSGIKFFAEKAKESLAPPIEVTTADGSKYPAHHVIFTASLGVLQHSHLTLFTPNLPEKQQQAIALMDFGIGEKVFLEYDSPFWEELYVNVTNICFLWEGEDQKEDVQRRYWDHAWYRAVDSANTLDSAKNVLELLISGKPAQTVVQKTEQEIKDDVTKFFRKVLQNDAIPAPTRVWTTTWSSNPYFRGARSYVSQDSIKQNVLINEAFEPIWTYGNEGFMVPGLLFAGEATHVHRFSTVQGAIESGIKEAERLTKQIDEGVQLRNIISKMKLMKERKMRHAEENLKYKKDIKEKFNESQEKNQVVHDEM